jgi:hypothetical protein
VVRVARCVGGSAVTRVVSAAVPYQIAYRLEYVLEVVLFRFAVFIETNGRGGLKNHHKESSNEAATNRRMRRLNDRQSYRANQSKFDNLKIRSQTASA